MSEQFYVEGKNGAMVKIESETGNGRIVVTASTERLSEAAFRRALRECWPGVEFTVYKDRWHWRGVSQ